MSDPDLRPALRAQLEALPRYQLHVLLQNLTPYVMPFTTDPNETGAFLLWSDVEAFLNNLGEVAALLAPQEAKLKTDDVGDVVCPHGTAMDVHCCTCHSGFVFDMAHECPPTLADAAEMLWVVLANVSGGDWTQQSPEWQEAAARYRDQYFAAALLAPPPQRQEKAGETKENHARGDGSCSIDGRELPQRPSVPTSTSVERKTK